ncbi:hypothetical protein BHE74_00037505 [Ensete ventricosum]|nr:hypothetical protein BHE74_00037505 [Ensete ventricosum]
MRSRHVVTDKARVHRVSPSQAASDNPCLHLSRYLELRLFPTQVESTWGFGWLAGPLLLPSSCSGICDLGSCYRMRLVSMGGMSHSFDDRLWALQLTPMKSVAVDGDV